MDTWIALLRGVNVGGHNKLPMADFRDLLAGLGYDGVATYIQSGNAVFRAPGNASAIAGQIQSAMAQRFGFDAETIVLTVAELQTAITENPFSQAGDAPTTLHLFFLSEPAGSVDETAMKDAATQGEQFRLCDQVLYFYTPNGMGRSALAGKLGRFIKTPMTGRNLRSCHKILALARAL